MSTIDQEIKELEKRLAELKEEKKKPSKHITTGGEEIAVIEADNMGGVFISRNFYCAGEVAKVASYRGPRQAKAVRTRHV